MNDALEKTIGARTGSAALAMLAHITAANHHSYDYMDWWATPWGRWSKRLAYRTEPVGNLVFSAPILLVEWFCPGLREVIHVPRRVYPISVAHHGLTCLEFHQALGGDEFLAAAGRDVELLLAMAAPSHHGLAWGFPFVWPSNSGIVPANLPMATQTAYGFDLLDGLWLRTGDERYRSLLLQVTAAMDREYENLQREHGTAHTYGGRGYGDVAVNAVSYRMHILARASDLGGSEYRATAESLADYIVSRQEADGSWFYGETPKNQFIDHFHTCFVLKNLARANRVLGRSDITSALAAGAGYYWANLFDEHGLPRPFARTVRLNVVRYESYDFAECLGLFAVLGTDLGFTRRRLGPVLEGFFEHLALGSGAARFRVHRFPTPVGVPYYRYGMSALMLSLATLTGQLLREDGGP